MEISNESLLWPDRDACNKFRLWIEGLKLESDDLEAQRGYH